MAQSQLNDKQAHELVDLLWPYMKKASGFNNRVQTAWGSKTKDGLVACIARICFEHDPNNEVCDCAQCMSKFDPLPEDYRG